MNPCLHSLDNLARSLVSAGKSPAQVALEARNYAKAYCKKEPPSDDQINLILGLAEPLRLPNFTPQNFGAFMLRSFPPKEPLIDGVLYKRDFISLTGRRRHGKTTLLANLAAAGAATDRDEYLGYKRVHPFTTLFFFLEDDGREIQDKLGRMRNEVTIDESRLHLYVRKDFFDRQIPIGFEDTKGEQKISSKFKAFVLAACEAAKPDLIVFDNLGMLIGADYTNSRRIHALMEMVYALAQKFDAAILIAAHPKKGNKLDAQGAEISLRNDPEKFFEECMGSSHFINSTGSLWGIERDKQAGRADLLLGAQRAADTESFTLVEKNDNDWLIPVDDMQLARESVLNTQPRVAAWNLIPADRDFTYIEAKAFVRPAMKSAGSFNPWWKELLRMKVVRQVSENTYRKAVGSSSSSSQQPQQTQTTATVPTTPSKQEVAYLMENDPLKTPELKTPAKPTKGVPARKQAT